MELSAKALLRGVTVAPAMLKTRSGSSDIIARYGAQVYIVVQFNGKFQTEKSVEGEQWPPSMEKRV